MSFPERMSMAEEDPFLDEPTEPEFYVVEAVTHEGPLCERYATYEEACRRVEQLSGESLVSMPLVFKQLTDGSQRLVREDGKPLQWHRLPEDAPEDTGGPVPLTEETELPEIRFIEPETGGEELPVIGEDELRGE